MALPISKTATLFVVAGIHSHRSVARRVQIVPTFELLRNSQALPHLRLLFVVLNGGVLVDFVAPYVMGGGMRAVPCALPRQRRITQKWPTPACWRSFGARCAAVQTRHAQKFWAIRGRHWIGLAFGSSAPLYLYRLIYYIPILNLFGFPRAI